MEINVSIMTWINRFLIILFLTLILLSSFNNDFLYLVFILAFFIGAFQLFSFLFSTFYFKKMKKHIKLSFLIYGILVIFYAAFSYALTDVFSLRDYKIVLWTIPVLLSIFWTFILESIKKEI